LFDALIRICQVNGVSCIPLILVLHLEDRPDGVVDLLKLFGGCAAQVLDEAATRWAIDLQSERPAQPSDPHGQQRGGVGIHDVHRIDRGQVVVGFTALAETMSLVVDRLALAITGS
jgi:hypothetical protein